MSLLQLDRQAPGRQRQGHQPEISPNARHLESTGNTRSSLTVLKDGLCFRQTIARQRLTGNESRH